MRISDHDMRPLTEIFQVKVSNYPLMNNTTGTLFYQVGVEYQLMGSPLKFFPTSIRIIKDRVHVSFNDGGKHVFGYNENVELFYRPIKIEDGGTDNNGDNTKGS